MNALRGKLVSGGRLQLPADIRHQLALSDGDQVLMQIVDGELHVRPLRDAVTRVQTRLRAHITPGAPLSEDLLRDRRAEADA